LAKLSPVGGLLFVTQCTLVNKGIDMP